MSQLQIDVSALSEIVTDGAFYAMQSVDQALFHAVDIGQVSTATGLDHATCPHDFKLLVQGDGRIGTSIDDVDQLEVAAF
jgi:twitching motility protein PilT